MTAKFLRRLWCVGTILSVLVALPAFANTSERGLRVRHFEWLEATRVASSDEGNGYDSLTLAFRAYGRDFNLLLRPNDRFAAATAGSRVALYQGIIEGVPASWVRISLTSGVARGMFWDGRDLYLVDDASALSAAAASPEASNNSIIYRLTDAVSGAASAHDSYRSLLNELPDVAPSLASYRLDVAALGDADFRARYASEQEAREEILTRLNNVDGIFTAQLGLQIEPIMVETAPADAVALTSSDASMLLRQLARLRYGETRLNSRAITFLFTGRTFDDQRVGLAYTQTLCSPAYSVGLARASANSGLDSLIAAHEIAHILGAPHDGEKQCAATPRSRFLMTPALISSESIFSECSIESMKPQVRSASCVVALDVDGPAEHRYAEVPAVDGEEAASILPSGEGAAGISDSH